MCAALTSTLTSQLLPCPFHHPASFFLSLLFTARLLRTDPPLVRRICHHSLYTLPSMRAALHSPPNTLSSYKTIILRSWILSALPPPSSSPVTIPRIRISIQPPMAGLIWRRKISMLSFATRGKLEIPRPAMPAIVARSNVTENYPAIPASKETTQSCVPMSVLRRSVALSFKAP